MRVRYSHTAAAVLAVCLNIEFALADPPASVPADRVDAAVAKLRAEADELFSEKCETVIDSYMLRPRPCVDAITPESYEKVLTAMSGKLTGDPAKDTYIRYHLMGAVNRALQGLTTPAPKPILTQLIRALPEDITYTPKDVYTWEPYDIGRKYHDLMQSCYVTVGFAPFQRRVPAPESFQYLSGAQLTKAKANYAEAKNLEGKFKEVRILLNDAYNRRMGAMDWALRQYRGELYYATLVNNPSSLDELVTMIGKHSATNRVRAEDLAAFLGMAYSDGLLGSFNKDVLNSAAQKLRAAVVNAERSAKVPPGAKVIKGLPLAWDDHNWGARSHNLGEALFTVITGIETNRVPPPIKPEEYSRPVGGVPPKSRVLPVPPSTQRSVLRAEDITVADIDAAIARAVPALERFRPPPADLDNMSYRTMGLPSWPNDLWAPGQGALSTWAMLAAGEKYRSGWMQRRVNWVLNTDTPSTYDRAMRLQMISLMPPSEQAALIPWIKRDGRWLLETQTEQGGWETKNKGIYSTAWGDNVNSQYAMLGLWAASQSGFEVPNATWQKIDKYWRVGQRPPGSPGEGAWAVIPTAALQKGANLNDFKNQVSASMTAGGVLSLFLTETFLYGDKRIGVGQSFSPELLNGIRWLDANFSLDKLDGDSDFYYYAWTIQNVSEAIGYRTFNKIDWFRVTTTRLLNTQEADGSWRGPKGANVSTSFALLYLYHARGPLAICKLRFEPVAAAGRDNSAKKADSTTAWNNRPNDLYNFTRDASRRMEVPTSWQIADLDQPVYQLIESPLLYLATDKPFQLSEAHTQRLKEYLQAGGMLICVPEGRAPAPVIASMKALAEAVCPGREPVARNNTDKHPFYDLFAKVKVDLPTISYENALRPLVVIIERDIGRDLQMNRVAQREAFDLLDNLYLYASGRNTQRPRIDTNYLTRRNPSPKINLTVARIQYEGDFDPEPLAIPQLQTLMADRFNVNLNVSTVKPAQLTKATKAAFLTVTPKAIIGDQDIASLKKWINDGGTLWLDAAGGSEAAVDQLQAQLARLGLTDLEPLDTHPIMTGKTLPGGYDNVTMELRRYLSTRPNRPGLKAKFVDKHPAALVFSGDLTSGLAGMNHWGIVGCTPASARQIVANGLLYTIQESAPAPATATAPATAPTTRPSSVPATGPATAPVK